MDSVIQIRNDGKNENGEKLDIVVLLDNLRSAYNVGNIIRIVDAFGFKEICFTGVTACPPHKKIMKTAMGAEKYIEYRYIGDSYSAALYYKKKGYRILCLERTNVSKRIWTANYGEGYCIVVGNEALGIRDEILNLSDLIVEIPMTGFKNSINVSNAFGMLAYEIVRSLKHII
ncbi:MAG: TrmH family RNA methyltransferase [Proteobacteria bacterium]|nr:TrmH family RNA methyltransferase [Pseudomonadota bacterium]